MTSETTTTEHLGKLYVSGPIKGVHNAGEVFARAAADLARRGYEPLNPFSITPLCDCPDGVPLTDETRHYNCFMRGDLREMLACDGVAMLPGWERSKGALLEHFVALSVQMRVMSVAAWMQAAPSFAGASS